MRKAAACLPYAYPNLFWPQDNLNNCLKLLAGAPGFEPGNGGIKIRPSTLIPLRTFSRLRRKALVLDQQVTKTFPTNLGCQTPSLGHVPVLAERRMATGTRWLPQYPAVKTKQTALPREKEDLLRRIEVVDERGAPRQCPAVHVPRQGSLAGRHRIGRPAAGLSVPKNLKVTQAGWRLFRHYC
jgi:hypothetical protein